MTTEARVDFEVTDFERQVIARSAHVPVLVDLWAAWCGPCRFLGPIVEKLAREADGRWELVKVDTEANPDIAARYDVRGIPNLKLFVNGEVVAELAGALPEPKLRQWIEEHLPTVGKKRLAEVEQLLEAGDEAGAQRVLEDVLSAEPALDQARLLLARLLVQREPQRVVELLQHHAHLDDAPALLDLAHALALPNEQLPEGPVKDLVRNGLDALRANDPDKALERWVDAVVRDKAYHDELPRRLCIALFQLLGPQHPATLAWRRRFDMALY